MPTVSILIPAFRPNFLDLCIASALAQTYTDFELIISDDSGREFIEPIVAKWADPRIRYVKNPNLQQPGANRDNLLRLAQGKYAKFLFDDDFLLPRSIEMLLTGMLTTGAKIAYQSRHNIDSNGCVIASPDAVAAEGTLAVLQPSVFFSNLVGGFQNFVGEPSNMLIDLQALRAIDQPFAIDGGRMRFLTDVALLTNFAAHNHNFVAVGYKGAVIRRHAGQYSDPTAPLFSAGIFEWELVMRWSIQHGFLPLDRYKIAIQLVHNFYRVRLVHYPELELFLRLGGEPGEDGYLGKAFREALSTAYMTIELKQNARRK